MILGHPREESLCGALADAYLTGAKEAGHTIESIHLGSLDFDPIFRGGYEGSQALEPDLVNAQKQITWADHLVFKNIIDKGTFLTYIFSSITKTNARIIYHGCSNSK